MLGEISLGKLLTRSYIQSEAEKLRESLQRARTELDDLDKNISQIKEERDTLAASQPKMRYVDQLIDDILWFLIDLLFVSFRTQVKNS